MAEKNDNQLEIKKVNNISREIKPATERMLWGVSAGICEFNGCTNKLYSHHVTKEKVNLSEKAHIYAFSAGGKRPSLLRFTPKINDIDNLMLVCETMPQINRLGRHGLYCRAIAENEKRT